MAVAAPLTVPIERWLAASPIAKFHMNDGRAGPVAHTSVIPFRMRALAIQVLKVERIYEAGLQRSAIEAIEASSARTMAPIGGENTNCNNFSQKLASDWR
ncbi:hypothetical protein ABZP36_011042 [Zizania latifolia]